MWELHWTEDPKDKCKSLDLRLKYLTKFTCMFYSELIISPHYLKNVPILISDDDKYIL